MNGKDHKDLNVILERMSQADKDRDEIHKDIKFIKDNLFNPKEGLWAEVKDNSRFRENTSKWHKISGTVMIGILGKFVYDLFKG
jgi:uncharacterized protein YlaN (UPF0358 family)